MANYKKGTVGFWPDEEELKKAARSTRDAGYKKFDAITPFPVHGLDEACGLKRSWLPWVCFIFAITGTTLGWFFQYWVGSVNWPIIIGGKPYHAKT